MFTLFWWTVLVLPVFIVKSSQPFNWVNVDTVPGILFLLTELVIFFDLPGSQFLKNLPSFSLKNSILKKVVSENEEKIKKFRLVVLSLTAALIFVISGIFKNSGAGLGYLIFWFCINPDIAFALATLDQRKQYLRESIIQNLKGIFIGVIVFIGIFGIWFYFSK